MPNIGLGSCCFFRAQASALHQQKERRSFSGFRLLRSFKPKEQKDQPLKFWFVFFFISGDDAMKSNELKKYNRVQLIDPCLSLSAASLSGPLLQFEFTIIYLRSCAW